MTEEVERTSIVDSFIDGLVEKNGQLTHLYGPYMIRCDLFQMPPETNRPPANTITLTIFRINENDKELVGVGFISAYLEDSTQGRWTLTIKNLADLLYKKGDSEIVIEGYKAKIGLGTVFAISLPRVALGVIESEKRRGWGSFLIQTITQVIKMYEGKILKGEGEDATIKRGDQANAVVNPDLRTPRPSLYSKALGVQPRKHVTEPTSEEREAMKFLGLSLVYESMEWDLTRVTKVDAIEKILGMKDK